MSIRWDLNLEDSARKAILVEPPRFKALTEQILAQMTILCYHKDPCHEEAEYDRAIFCVQVGRTLFDWFFNSRNGYRAAYYVSEKRGLQANADFINALTPTLLAWRKSADNPDDEFIAKSLEPRSAKVWLAEHERGLCPRCNGEWTEPRLGQVDICNDRWELGDDLSSRRGRTAPLGTKLIVFGAFVNGGEPFITSRKISRAADLHKYGWT
jgi:hypothetical protein